MHPRRTSVWLFAGGLALASAACELDPIENPNSPTQESLLEGATAADLQLLATGLEASLRTDMEFYYQTASILGREYYDLRNTDPRYTGELLGAGSGAGVLDPNGFLTTRSYGALYRVVRNAEILITATRNASASLSEVEESALVGYAQAIKAYALLLVANRQYDNGIRLDVADPDNLGPFTASAAESYAGVQALFGEAADNLAGAAADSTAFPVRLSAGFDGFGEPIGFLEFVNALRARVALYQDDGEAALGYLDDSFFDLDGDLDRGVYHVFGASGNDQLNPLFYVPGQDRYFVQQDFLDDAEEGDTRIDELTSPFGETIVADGLTGTVQVTQYPNNTAPVPIIRNAELILIYAEVQIGRDDEEAVAALNVIRAAAGLEEFEDTDDGEALLDEVVRQRRYELFGEAQRWIDLRRLGRLDEIELDREGDEVFVQFPTPISEDL